jgi:hypothetical protein
LAYAAATTFGLSADEVRLSYTLQRTVNPATGLWLSDSPAQLAKANLIFPMARRQPAIGFELQYTDSRTTLVGSRLGRCPVSNLTEVGAWLRKVVLGYYQYHAVPGNSAQLPILQHLQNTVSMDGLRVHPVNFTALQRLAQDGAILFDGESIGSVYLVSDLQEGSMKC